MSVDLQEDATDALEQLRDLARGIYPPLLADRGLVPALEAQARKASVPTGVRSDETSYGTGLQGMADRLDAIGGALLVVSQPGEGTTVEGRTPV